MRAACRKHGHLLRLSSASNRRGYNLVYRCRRYRCGSSIVSGMRLSEADPFTAAVAVVAMTTGGVALVVAVVNEVLR